MSNFNKSETDFNTLVEGIGKLLGDYAKTRVPHTPSTTDQVSKRISESPIGDKHRQNLTADQVRAVLRVIPKIKKDFNLSPEQNLKAWLRRVLLTDGGDSIAFALQPEQSYGVCNTLHADYFQIGNMEGLRVVAGNGIPKYYHFCADK